MAITIRTNLQPRQVLHWHDLSPKERAEFDWLDTDDRQDEAEFVRYRGQVYCLDEFTSLRITGTPEFKNWHGVHADSFYSGILLRHQGDAVILATFYA